MTKDEAVQKLAKVGRLSVAHAEDLYDSIIPKPVVPQFVADWYEENNGDLNGALFTMVRLWGEKSINSDFYRWFRKNKEAFQTLVNMHQFGYEVEEEPRYLVKVKGNSESPDYLVDTVSIPYLLGYDTDSTFSDLVAKINEWAISHGLDKGNPKIEWMKVTEEVGEIRDVFLKPNDFDDPELALKDAIGDSIVTLVVLCLQLGYDVEECLKIAYNNIKDRKGIMIDDNFVKTR